MIKKYTHIFFDLDNTLWDFDGNSFHALKNTFSNFEVNGRSLDFERFYAVYLKHNSFLWQEYRNGRMVKKDLIRLRFQQTFDELMITGIDPLEMNLHYLTQMPFQKKLVDGASDLLEYLKGRGYHLFIITNGFREVQLKKMEETGLDKYFTKVYISEDIKSPKPSSEIFEYAIKSSNAKKDSSLMIGDDFQADIIGALDYGISAAWLNSSTSGFPNKQFKKEIKNNQVYSIRFLKELRGIL